MAGIPHCSTTDHSTRQARRPWFSIYTLKLKKSIKKKLVPTLKKKKCNTTKKIYKKKAKTRQDNEYVRPIKITG